MSTQTLLDEVVDVERADLTPPQRLRRLVQAALNRTAGEDVGPIGAELLAVIEAKR